MSWKDIYNKCNSRDLSRITVIKDNIELNSSVKNFNLENGYKLLIITLLIIAVLLIGFWSKPIIILYTMLIYVFSLVLGFIYNIYKIKIDSDGLFFKIFFNEKTTSHIPAIKSIKLKKEEVSFLLFQFIHTI